ncbi:hypothetical protein ACOMCU_01420 [Lysinibacillus sp. UGB7]|uniref:hypothetical protein n=1 Tax=Lysinibacillus sp. UGB7 TaxID=3411039 RepID=UPI003B7F97DD
MKLMNFKKVLKEFEESSTNTVRLLATRTQVVENELNIIKNGITYIFCVQPIEAESHYVLMNASDSKNGDMPFAVKMSDVRNGKVDCENIFSNNFLLVEGHDRIVCVLQDQSKSIVNIIHRLRGIKDGTAMDNGVGVDINFKEIDKWTYVIEIGAMHVPIIAQQFPDHLLDEMDELVSSGYVFDIDVELADYPFYHEGRMQ